MKRLEQVVYAVPVDRSHVLDPELIEEHARHNESLERLLCLLCKVEHGLADPREALEKVLGLLPQLGVELPGHQFVQVRGQRAHIRRDGHLIVVQNDHEVLLQMSGLVQSLERKPRGDGTVPDHRDHAVVFALDVPRSRHPEGRGDGRARMAHVKVVEGALFPFRKSAHAAELAERGGPGAPSGEQLVRVRLVPHVPHDTVARRIKGVVEGDGQFDHAEARSKMPAGTGDDIEDLLPELRRKGGEFSRRNFPKIFGIADGIEYHSVPHEKMGQGSSSQGQVRLRPLTHDPCPLTLLYQFTLLIIYFASSLRGSAFLPKPFNASRASPTTSSALRRDSSRPRKLGKVFFPFSRSLPMSLPSSSCFPVTSRMSSTIWNASPAISP